MKKTILTIIGIGALAVSSFGQGYVSWSGVAGTFIAATNSTQYSTFAGSSAGLTTGGGTTGVTAGSGTQLYYYQILIGSVYNGTAATAPTTLGQLGGWTAASLLTATNSLASNGRIVQQNSSTGVQVSGWPGGQTNNIIMVGWSANLGTTYADALNAMNNWNSSYVANAYFGVSSVGYIAPNTASDRKSVV